MKIQILSTIIAFIFGNTIGSFLSVFIYRHYNKKPGIIAGRSHCPNCRKKLQPRDMIPLFSYIINKGKCRFCKKKIGSHYFYLELLTGFIFALWTIVIPFYTTFETSLVLEFTLMIVLSTLLMAIFFYDLKYQEIPDILNIPAIVLALFSAFVLQSPSWSSIGIATAIILVFFGGQILLSHGKWLGIGDLILGALMAILLGWQNLLLALGLAYVIGAIYATTLIITKKANSKSQIAFGPFLVTGTFIAMLAGNKLITWYLNLII